MRKKGLLEARPSAKPSDHMAIGPKQTVDASPKIRQEEIVSNQKPFEPFDVTPIPYGLVYLTIDGVNYALTDYLEPLDYFGETKDLSSMKFNAHSGPKKSNLKGVKFATNKINKKISEITLVNSEQIIKDKETGEEYAFLDTQCIIFTFEDSNQLSFTKDDFCEMISIYRGKDAKSDIQNFLEDYLNSFSSDVEGKAHVNYIDL